MLQDVDLKYDANGNLRTASGLYVANNATVTGTLALNDGATINFGAASDVNLYRGGSNLLQTDDSLVVGGTGSFGGDVSLNSHKLTSVTDPASAQDAATKNYVDTSFPSTSQPADSGYLAWTFDPAAFAASVTLTVGTIYLAKIPIRQAFSATKIWYANNSAQGTLTAGQNFIGIINSSGTRLVTTSIDSATAQGVQQISISSTAVAAPFVWVGIVTNASSGSFQMVIGSVAANVRSAFNGPLTAASLRYATCGTSQTSIPSSITPANNVASTVPFWAALS
jgi:hypothetical protein